MYNNTTISFTDDPLNEFVAGQPLAIKFSIGSGYYCHCNAEFISIDKGLVKVKILNVIEPDWCHDYFINEKYPGKIARVRAKNCYVYGKGKGEFHPRCHWFKNTKTPAD